MNSKDRKAANKSMAIANQFAVVSRPQNKAHHARSNRPKAGTKQCAVPDIPEADADQAGKDLNSFSIQEYVIAKELVDWFFKFESQREKKLSIENWLDPLVMFLEEVGRIRSHASTFPIIGIIGASQVGKSVLLGMLFDGDAEDGSDSAITRPGVCNARFVIKNGINSVPPSTVIMNPANGGADATGIPTLFLPIPDAKVNDNFPVEEKLFSRKDLLLSISLGYYAECVQKKKDKYNKASILAMIPPASVPANEAEVHISEKSKQEAYWLANDFANAIKDLNKADRRFSLSKNEWKDIRKELVRNASRLGVGGIEKIMQEVLWDSVPKLNSVCESSMRMLAGLQKEWKDYKVIAQLSVGSYILNCDSILCLINQSKIPRAKQIRDDLYRLRYEIVEKDREIHIFVDKNNAFPSNNTELSGMNFGVFQFLISEQLIPYRVEAIRKHPRKKDYVKLAESCAFLDLPGVPTSEDKSSSGSGDNLLAGGKQSNALDPATLDDEQVFTRILKRGKTQWAMNRYANLGVDSFLVLARAQNNIAFPKPLNNCVWEWMESMKKEDDGSYPPLFFNITFVNSFIHYVRRNHPNDLSRYIERIQALTFAKPEYSEFFATTYKNFFEGKIDPDIEKQKDSVVDDLLATESYMSYIEATGFDRNDLLAPFNEDGGIGYMFKKIAEKGLSCARRSERAEAMVKQYIEQVKAAILDNLPRDGDAVARERTEQLNACLSTIRNIIDESDPNRNRDLCAEINSIISPAEETFDNLSGDCFEHYVRSQITKWRDRMLPLPKFEDEETQLLIPEKQHEALIETLYNKATAYQKDIVESLVSTYSNILDKRAEEEIRAVFSRFFSNVLRGNRNKDATAKADLTEEDDPFIMVNKLYLELITGLLKFVFSNGMISQAGDSELESILKKFDSEIR